MTERIHKAVFRPRARMLDILGGQLIRHHRIALFELVKNAYDADSPAVEVRFMEIQNKDNAQIEVLDTGLGMDLDTVLHVWLEPASDYQEIRRLANQRSAVFNRLPVGEKGVGRFAVQKLGRKLHMVTRRQGHSEIVVDLDWKELTSHTYLEDAGVTVVEREPTVFTGDQHGTRIRIIGLNQDWSRGDVRRLHRSVMAMTSPFDNVDRFAVNMTLKPDPGWLDEDMFTSERAEDFALFHFDFTLDESGFSWDYRHTPMPLLQAAFAGVKPRIAGAERDTSFEFFHRAPPDEETWRKRPARILNTQNGSHPLSGIGPVKGRFLVFDLDREVKAKLHDVEGLTRFLKEQGGIRVYRNGMRVYDYGEPGNDWLGLDVRRVNKPVGRLSNNLILGEIHLDLSASPSLREKTNREGFEENEAYQELRYAVLCALTTLEAERDKDKSTLRHSAKIKEEGSVAGIASPEEAIQELRRRVVNEGLAPKLGSYVDRVEKTYKEARDVLMSAVGAGLGLSLVFHEIERGVKGMLVAMERNTAPDRLMGMARQLVEMLEGASMLVRKSDRENIKASDLFRYAAFAHKSRCEYHHIRLLDGFAGLKDKDFSVKGSRRMLTAALSNLLDNAIHWIKQNPTQGETIGNLWVGPSSDLGAPAIVVADSGMGFQDDPETVIRPFFTRKTDGMGLGLYYTDMAMKAHAGHLIFPDHADVEIPAACTGAVAAMVFGEEKQ